MYFLHTSMLGTHTFLVFLSAFFFLGLDDLGRGLCYALAFGVYMSSYLKDLLAFNPLYEFYLMALFLGAHVYDLYRLASLSITAFATWVVVLFVYVFSIVVGRLYTGIHGFMDCSVGIILRIISWLLQHFVMPEVEKWVQSSNWNAPLVVTVVYLLFVNQHSSPVDDCRCFECLSHPRHYHQLFSKRVPALNTDLFTSVTSGAALDSPATIMTWAERADPAAPVVPLACVGESHAPAPPAPLHARDGICAWPAPHTASRAEYDRPRLVCRRGRGRGCRCRERAARAKLWAVKRPASPSGSVVQEKAVVFEEASEGGTGGGGEVKHYDADVLTNVVVYVGIAAIATVMVPALFEAF
ncbi:hypothetical protein EDB89DRAFT_2081265 [Lactarius sanguifluus]|nr:hypothetical protein EDB89DRAFT_2081265 [Lactarius sanguifluus]